MADLLREQLKAEVNIESGSFGEFSVLVGNRKVIRRTAIALPHEEEILEAVRARLEKDAPRSATGSAGY